MQRNNLCERITEELQSSDYHFIATGLRDVGFEELFLIIKFIRGMNKNSISLLGNKLNDLYTWHPDTIAMSKASQKTAPCYIEGKCFCYLPEGPCYLQELREQKLRETDYRGTPEYKKWRTSIFERDEYTCQDCLVIGGELNAHHIKPFKKFPDLRYEIDNGVTLCVGCHRKRHKKVIYED